MRQKEILEMKILEMQAAGIVVLMETQEIAIREVVPVMEIAVPVMEVPAITEIQEVGIQTVHRVQSRHHQ